jgi:hypothetical protein
MKSLSTLAERLLTVFVPKVEAEASDYCHWETKCTGSCALVFNQRRKRLCCTTQDSENACSVWEKDGCC